VANPYKTKTIPFGKFFIEGNFVDGSPEVSSDNWLGVTMDDGTESDKKAARLASPFAAENIATQSAKAAYEEVLRRAGASFKRDTLDERIVENVKERTGGFVDVQGGYPHGTDYNKTVNAWPTLNSIAPQGDADQDGMPDNWEKSHKLNSADKNDAALFTLNKHFTNVEVYLNSIVQ
jgi:hypothetical protein